MPVTISMDIPTLSEIVDQTKSAIVRADDSIGERGRSMAYDIGRWLGRTAKDALDWAEPKLPTKDEVVDFAYSAAITTATVTAATAATMAVATSSTITVSASTATIIVAGTGYLAYLGGKWVVIESHNYFFDRPMNDAAIEYGSMAGYAVGLMVGPMIGEAITAELGANQFVNQKNAWTTKEARRLTEQTYRANRAEIDPQGLRGPDWHLDHKIPVKCAVEMNWTPDMIAHPSNLVMLEAAKNLSLGAKFCR